MSKKLLATLAVSAVLFTGCGLKSSETIIKVNDQNITQAQFDKAFDKQANNGMLAKLGIDIKSEKNGFMYMLIKERVTNELVVKALIDQEIEKRGITVSKEDINSAIKEIVTQLGSKEQLDQLLKERGISAAEFKSDLTEQVKIKKLTSELGSSKVSDADAKKFYDQNAAKFKYPDKVRASHILIAASPKELEEMISSDAKNKGLTKEEVAAKVGEEMKAKLGKAEKLLAEIKKDPSQFGKIARENSEDTTSAVNGGDLGFFAKEEMVPEFAAAAFAAKPNTVVTTVIKTQFGYHIIIVTDRMAAGQQPFEKVKNDIKAYLEDQKQVELLDKLVESLKKNAKIEYVDASYDPKTMREDVQKQLKEGAKEAKEIKK